MSKTLYIIGNGFDIFHGLPTSYRCFLCFMLKEHLDDAERLGFIFDRKNPDKLWSDFENELETFDVLELVKRNIHNWIDSNNVYEIRNQFDEVHCKLKTLFHDWVLQIQMALNNGKRLRLEDEALFLTFNYTNTLELFYHIDSARICHIHMDTLNEESHAPIVGHSHTNNCVEKDKCKVCKYVREYGKYPNWAENAENFAETIIAELNGFWDGLAKEPNVQHIDGEKIYTIRGNRRFFDDCCELENIYVIGCSLSVVDKDYFKEIYELSPNARWNISIYNEKESEVKEKLANLLDCKVENLHIGTFKMDEL